ncbi:MAG TPA: cytochrome c [Bacteroidia bacterium]|nr:cytochrome c [Bacteroidia bacterium]
MKKTTYTILAFGIGAFAAASLLTACISDKSNSPGYEFFPDMYRSPGAETNMMFGNSVSPDSMANRLPAPGTIPVGFTPFPYENTPMGDTLASKFWRNPHAVSDAYEEEGKYLYTNFCSYCHGAKGDGKGPLVESGKYVSAPPDYKTIYGKGNLTDGHVYHVITYGKNVMGSHASQLSPEERWKVIAYVQRLGRGDVAYSEFKKPATDTTGASKTGVGQEQAGVNPAGKSNTK